MYQQSTIKCNWLYWQKLVEIIELIARRIADMATPKSQERNVKPLKYIFTYLRCCSTLSTCVGKAVGRKRKSIRGEWLFRLHVHKPKASSPTPPLPICLKPGLKIHKLKAQTHLHQRWKQHFKFLFFFSNSRMSLEAKQLCRRYRVTSNGKSGTL